MLAAFVAYGLPALFGVILLSSVGAPLPSSLALIAGGSFAAQGETPLWQVIVLAGIAAVLGDQLGYGLARRFGRRVIAPLAGRLGLDDALAKAEGMTTTRGGAAIFFSRWLVASLGPSVNLACGLAGYPWPRFLVCAVLGEAIWVSLYVLAGWAFSDHVQALAQILGDLTWVIVGVVVASLLAWQLTVSLQSHARDALLAETE
ncbi:MAG: DedA family protein [Armatimonadetes bacterium]|nr:DedA family protein [Armatimonadota bacterium]